MASADKKLKNMSGNRIVQPPITPTTLTKPTATAAKIPSKGQLKEINIVVPKILPIKSYPSNANRVIRLPMPPAAAATTLANADNVNEPRKPMASTSNVNKFMQIVSNNTKQYTNTRLSSDNKSDKIQWQIPQSTVVPVTSIISVPKTTVTTVPAPKITIPDIAEVTLTPTTAFKSNSANKQSNISFIHTFTKAPQIVPPITIVEKTVYPIPIKVVSKEPQTSQAPTLITFATPSTSVIKEKANLQKVTPIVTRISTAPNGSKPVHVLKADETKQISTNNPVAQNVIKVKLPMTVSSTITNTKNLSTASSDSTATPKSICSVIQSPPGTSTVPDKAPPVIKISRNAKNQLEQEYAKTATASGLMPREMQEALTEFHKWRRHNDPDEKMLKTTLNRKLTEFIEYFRNKSNLHKKRISATKTVTQPLITDEVNNATSLPVDTEPMNPTARSSDENDLSSDYGEPQIKKRLIEKAIEAPVALLNDETNNENDLKPARNVANIDALNQNKGINVQITYGTFSNTQSVIKSTKPTPPVSTFIDLTTASASTEVADSITTSASPANSSNGTAGHSNIQILNGQLSDLEGPIKLMNKMENVPVSTNTAGSVSSQTNASNSELESVPNSNFSFNPANIHQNLLNIFNQQHNKQMASDFRNKKQDKKVDEIKRGARRARSLSLSGGNRAPNSKSRVKNNELARQIHATLNGDDAKNQIESIELDEKMMKSVFEPERRILGKSKQKTYVNQNRSEGNSWTSTPAQTPPLVQTPGEQINDLEKFISWNNSIGAGKLPNSSIIFEKNEFGKIEFKTAGEMFVRQEGRQSPKMYGKRSKKLNCESNSDRTYLSCGHKDFAECFDDVIVRTERPDFIVINNRKPYEYYSSEYKELIRLAIQREKGRCDQITPLKITEAMIISDSFKLPTASNDFSWMEYIERHKSQRKSDDSKQITPAPLNLFNNPFPCSFNRFVVGHKLEAIDPQNCALFCVCTVVEKKGFRIKLHFDGYHNSYDFWVNADSKDIFPAGWCNKTARELSSPHKRLTNNRSSGFDWGEYLTSTKALSAPRSCFSHLNSPSTNKNAFKIGMKLEADDIKFTRKICVATIGDVLDTRILVTFDGFDEASNYWADISSPYIHPVNWHFENGYSITPPPDMKTFNWSTYLRSNRSDTAPEHAFCTRKLTEFSVGMAIEIVDKKNPSLLRPAIITMVDEYEIKVLFIGWPEKYAYWVDDDSPDIHPINWAKKTGHPIEPPYDSSKNKKHNVCGINFCTGIGNYKRPEVETHTTLEECPYEISNWSSANDLLNRPNRVERKNRSVPLSSSSAGRIRVNRNPALSTTQISLQPMLNPIELATMSPQRAELFHRLQVSAKFLLKNVDSLSQLRDHWLNKMEPLQPIQMSTSIKNPLNWSADEVANFVSQLPNCSMIGQVFIQHDIDGIAFLSLRQNDMVDIMGLSLGTAIKVFNRILFLREECNAHYIQYV